MDTFKHFPTQSNLPTFFFPTFPNTPTQALSPSSSPFNMNTQSLPFNGNCQPSNMPPTMQSYFMAFLQSMMPQNQNSNQSQMQGLDLQSLSQGFQAYIQPNGAGLQNSEDAGHRARRRKVFKIIKESPSSLDTQAKVETEMSCEDLQSETTTTENSQARKYNILTKFEKEEILEHLKLFGVDKTFKAYEKSAGNLSKRKLRQWLKTCDVVKKKKGKQSSDAARDKALCEWYEEYKEEHGKTPDRRQVKKKALELSTLADFKASKGWLDKFCKKFKFDLAPMKIHGQKKKEGSERKESEDFILKEESPMSVSTACSQGFSTYVDIASRKREEELRRDDEFFPEINSYFSFGNEQNFSFDKLDMIPSFESNFSLYRDI